ncbi:hypothetical protein NL676_015040 [Syzygium grande]|nr:hypothetical protein NL676_015040 [Syzygium grande]
MIFLSFRAWTSTFPPPLSKTISLSFRAFSNKFSPDNTGVASLLTSRLLLRLVKGFFYKLLQSCNPDILNYDHGFTIEGSSQNPFSQVVSTPQLDPPFHYPSPDPQLAATFPRGLDLCVMPPPLPSPPPPPPVSMETSLESSENSDGVAAHDQVELKSLFDSGPVDHHCHHDPVTVARQIMPLLHLNDLGSLNERLGMEFSSAGVSSDREWGYERDGGGDDRS